MRYSDNINLSSLRTMHGSPRAVRLVLCTLVLVFSASAFYVLLPRLLSQIYLLRAKSHEGKGYYGLAIQTLQKAQAYGPRDSEIPKVLGDIYYSLGEQRSQVREAFRYNHMARDAYLQATSLNPLDVEISYALAMAEWRLEQFHQHLNPDDKSIPYNALPYFQNTIRFRPNGIYYNYMYAQYLVQHERNEELFQLIRSLARIYPPIYGSLKTESFWSPTIKNAVKQGIRDAIHEKNQLREAHRTMSALLADDGHWAEAISHYRDSLTHRQSDNSPGDYIHLGRLHLKNGQLKEAEDSFFQALDKSSAKENELERLHGIYKDEGYADEFYQFCEKVESRYALSYRTKIFQARTLIDLQRYYQAQRILTDLNDQDPTAEAYYLLARIAEIEKDWGEMEVAIHKATMLDPRNMHYRQIFVGLLKRLGKLESAEEAIARVIESSEEPSPGLYSERAQIRWNREDYSGAVEDWKSAILLSPRKAAFYAQAAEAYMKLGEWSDALSYYQKAVKLEPQNKNYSKRYLELKAGRS